MYKNIPAICKLIYKMHKHTILIKLLKVLSYGSLIILLMSLDPNEIMSHRYTYMIQ